MSIHMQREVSFSFPMPKIMHYHLFTANRHELLPQWSCVRAEQLKPVSVQGKHTPRQNPWKEHNAIPLAMRVHPRLVSPAGRRALIRKLLSKSFAELYWLVLFYYLYTPNLSRNQPVQRQWQERNVNGKLRKHTRNNVKKPQQISKKWELRTSKSSQPKSNLSGQEQRELVPRARQLLHLQILLKSRTDYKKNPAMQALPAS